MNIRKQLNEIYLDYYNNYLTISVFAEHNLISREEAAQLIALGRKVNHEGIDFQHQPEAMNY